MLDMDLSLPIALPVRYRPPWRAAAGVLLAVLLLGGGWWWLRDSSLVSVREVRISGVRGPQSAQIDALLSATARRMTTMDFDAGALRSAVASFPVVKALHVSTGFPHMVRIRVIERPPVATLLAGSQRTAVAADGIALGPQLAWSSLPVLTGSFSPIPGQRVSDVEALAAVSVLGAAPSALARFVTRVFTGPEGLTVAMRNGLLVYFGDPTRPHAKWLSLARVLADPGSAGARYVDVRVPERPAAGLPGATSPTPFQAGSSASPAATLAERLEQAVGGNSTSVSPGASSSGATESSPPETGEKSSPASESTTATQSSSTAAETTPHSTGGSSEATGGSSSGMERGTATGTGGG
jgi:cell division protein FtsQ